MKRHNSFDHSWGMFFANIETPAFARCEEPCPRQQSKIVSSASARLALGVATSVHVLLFVWTDPISLGLFVCVR